MGPNLENVKRSDQVSEQCVLTHVVRLVTGLFHELETFVGRAHCEVD